MIQSTLGRFHFGHVFIFLGSPFYNRAISRATKISGDLPQSVSAFLK
jgi:hypothetical protein